MCASWQATTGAALTEEAAQVCRTRAVHQMRSGCFFNLGGTSISKDAASMVHFRRQAQSCWMLGLICRVVCIRRPTPAQGCVHQGQTCTVSLGLAA